MVLHKIFPGKSKDVIISESRLFKYGRELLETVFGLDLGVIPNKKFGINGEDERTIFTGEGITSEGYVYKCEFWTLDQISNFTYYIDADALEDIGNKDGIIAFLISEDMVEFSNNEKYIETRAMTDLSKNKIASQILS